MIKRNMKMILVTTVITLLPLIVGLLLWNSLPDEIPTHWNAEGQIDGWSSKAFAVFGLPLFMTGIHIFCTLATSIDPRSDDINRKMINLVLWICPVMSLVTHGIVYTTAMGYGFALDIPMLMCLLFGAMFIFIGNYLPKCKQNYTIGIKVPWALHDEENWNKTHHFGGWVWTIGGVIIIATSFWGNFWLFLTITLVMIIAPTVYSYLHYRKHRA